MNDYILIPNQIKNVDTIHSRNLHHFFHAVNPKDNKISLDIIRSIYLKDKNYFLDVVDELTLRGFHFFTSKPNNILPTFTPDFSKYIVATSNQNRYKNINFQLLGLSGFTNRFQVDSDLFFHFIPLRNFLHINASLDLGKLQKEFENAGFTIHSEEKEYLEKVIKEKAFVKESSDSSDNDLVLISAIFHENKFNSFKRFCHKNNIQFLKDITPDHLSEYRKMKGVGEKKYQLVLERINDFETDGLSLQPENSCENVVPEQNEFASTMFVKDVFHENKFNRFLDYCYKKGIETISDITNEYIDDFSKQPGIGRKKIEQVIEKLQEIRDTLNSETGNVFSAGDLYPYIKDMDVSSLLDFFHLEKDETLSMQIADIEGKNLQELDDSINKKILFLLSQTLKSLTVPAQILEQVKSHLTERDLKIIKLRYGKNKTLESTGEQLQVTRERVRQLEAKIVKTVSKLLHSSKFNTVLSLLFNSEPFIPAEKLAQTIGEENHPFIELFKVKDNFNLPFTGELDVFFLNKKEKDAFMSKLTDIFAELPETFKYHDYKDLIEDILEIESDSLLESIFTKYGYRRYGSLFTQKKLSTLDVLESIFQNHIKGPFRLDDDSVKELRKLAMNFFDFDIGESLRAVDARIRDSKNIILVDRRTFQWFEPEKVDQSLISEIQQYLEERFQEAEVINVEEIFNAYEEKLQEHNINNKLHLYSIIKYFLDDEFSIGKGNTLNIYRSHGEKLDIEEQLVAAIRKLGGTCTKDQLDEELKWQRYKIDLAISKSDQILSWDENTVKLFETLKISKEIKAELIHVVENNMQEGYATAGIILEQMFFNKKLAPFIQKNGLDKTKKLASIIKVLMPDIKGHSNFLYKEDSDVTSFEEVIVKHFTDEVHRNDIYQFILEHGYKQLMASNLMDKIIELGYFIEIDLGIYYPTSKFHISDDVIETLKRFIIEKLGNKDYISLNLVEGYRSVLPSIPFRWNPHLMKSILVKHGFREIQKVYKDYRYDTNLIVREESSFQTFEELVYYILTNEYNGNMHEAHVYDFLAQKGLLRKRGPGKERKLPVEIRQESERILVDNLGFVKLK